MVPVQHVQALQQANTILSKITTSLQQQEDTPQEKTRNASNSFGVTSYGGCQGCNTGQRGPCTMSNVKTMSQRSLGAMRTHTVQSPEVVEASCKIDSHAGTCCLGANFL